jgi:hypothetical protein
MLLTPDLHRKPFLPVGAELSASHVKFVNSPQESSHKTPLIESPPPHPFSHLFLLHTNISPNRSCTALFPPTARTVENAVFAQQWTQGRPHKSTPVLRCTQENAPHDDTQIRTTTTSAPDYPALACSYKYVSIPMLRPTVAMRTLCSSHVLHVPATGVTATRSRVGLLLTQVHLCAFNAQSSSNSIFVHGGYTSRRVFLPGRACFFWLFCSPN